MDSRGKPANWRPSAIFWVIGWLLLGDLFPTLVLIEDPCYPHQKVSLSWITDKNHKKLPSSPHMPSQRTYLVPISSHMPSPSSYAQPNTIPGPSSYVQPQTILQLFPVVRASRSQLMVHLHFIRDVDIHPHHLHVHGTWPIAPAGCSPCSPLPHSYFGWPDSFYPPTGRSLRRGTKEPSLHQSTQQDSIFASFNRTSTFWLVITQFQTITKHRINRLESWVSDYKI